MPARPRLAGPGKRPVGPHALCFNMAMTPPTTGTVLSQHVGLVEAPVHQVRDLVLAVRTGRVRGTDVPLVLGPCSGQDVVITGGPTTFAASVATVPLTIDVDRAAGRIQARGQWWWCGAFQVDPHPDGTLVTQRTYSRASGLAAKLVPFTVGRRHRASGLGGLRYVLDECSSRLGCRARIMPSSAGRRPAPRPR